MGIDRAPRAGEARLRHAFAPLRCRLADVRHRVGEQGLDPTSLHGLPESCHRCRPPAVAVVRMDLPLHRRGRPHRRDRLGRQPAGRRAARRPLRRRCPRRVVLQLDDESLPGATARPGRSGGAARLPAVPVRCGANARGMSRMAGVGAARCALALQWPHVAHEGRLRGGPGTRDSRDLPRARDRAGFAAAVGKRTVFPVSGPPGGRPGQRGTTAHGGAGAAGGPLARRPPPLSQLQPPAFPAEATPERGAVAGGGQRVGERPPAVGAHQFRPRVRRGARSQPDLRRAARMAHGDPGLGGAEPGAPRRHPVSSKREPGLLGGPGGARARTPCGG